MSVELRLSLHRRIIRLWARSITLLRQMPGQVVLTTERTLRRMFARDGSLVPIPVRAVVDRPRIRHQSRD
jgi:hypothetical protein